jgi:hypothetical protein
MKFLSFAALAVSGAVLMAVGVLHARLSALEGRLAMVPRPRPVDVAEPAEAAVPAAPSAAPTAKAEEAAAPVIRPTEPAIREQVVRALEEIRKEEDAKWSERVKRAGVDVIAKAVGLTRDQQDLITPMVEEHLKAIQTIWWPGTEKDEKGEERTLSYEEKVKRSEEARAKVDERVRLFLMGTQRDAYETWAKGWREEAPKRTGEVGPLRWF